MSTNPNKEPDLPTRLKQDFETIASTDAANVCTRDELGPTYNFSSLLPLVTRAIALAHVFRGIPFHVVPNAVLEEISDPLQMIKHAIAQMNQFTLKKDPQNAVRHHENIRQKLEQALRASLPLLASNYAIVAALADPQQEQVRNKQLMLENAVKKTESQLAATDSLVSAAKQAAGEVAVTRYSIVFKETAVTHDKWAKRWLLFTILIALLVVAGALALFLPWPSAPNTPATPSQIDTLGIIQHTVPRLVVVSIGYFLLVWAGRNYRAHRHLHVVNTHRWNALETFGAFVKQTDDKAIKDAVLLEATHCVFGASVTGYLGPDENTPLPPGADLLKSLTQK